ncbi:MAG: glycosyltransferase, partial [Bacteroidales bacterium]|nr:glycosyltransferase [Bacteroidales bacterium]
MGNLTRSPNTVAVVIGGSNRRPPVKLSVVINTYNRAATLQNTLEGLRYQTYPDFEVVVVNGPSTDHSDAVLQSYGHAIRVYRCPEVHLSRSRNIGVTQAAGEVVAFIDDDAVPDPRWIEELVAGYDQPQIGGVGGLVYDHTGAKFQYTFSSCSRLAVPLFQIQPPFDALNRPGADPFLYLQGTNCSFRRDMLTEIGGFNEEIEYHLDEAEICLLSIDAGYPIRALNGARVYHKYARSHIRSANRVTVDPYATVKNHCTFAVRYGRVNRPLTEVLAAVSEYLDTVKRGGYGNRDHGLFTEEQLAYYLERTEQAAEVGIRQGLTKPRPFTRIPPARPQEFRPFPTLMPAGGRLKTVFVSREYPPQQGGIGRWTAELATEYARLGHEVRVITHGDTHTVDFQDGVWLHRIPDGAIPVPALSGHPVADYFAHAAAVHQEIERIHDAFGVDVVSAPIWGCEGTISRYDSRWPTVLSLHTTLATIAEMGGAPDSLLTRELLALERETARDAPYLYANSRAVLNKLTHDTHGLNGTAFIVPHGSLDVRDEYLPSPKLGTPIRVLFVGRIETRKGVDVLLQAAYRVLTACPNAELHLIGQHNPLPGESESILERHYRTIADQPDLASRILFRGLL